MRKYQQLLEGQFFPDLEQLEVYRELLEGEETRWVVIALQRLHSVCSDAIVYCKCLIVLDVYSCMIMKNDSI